MRLTSFRAQNFKSLIDIELTDLQDINVFYGPNNVGKSNILQAMDLFFGMLGARSPDQVISGHAPEAGEKQPAREALMVPADFHVLKPHGGEIAGTVMLSPDEAGTAGLDPSSPREPVVAAFELAERDGLARVREWTITVNGEPLRNLAHDHPQADEALDVDLLPWDCNPELDETQMRRSAIRELTARDAPGGPRGFALVQASRVVRGAPTDGADLSIIPGTLRDALYYDLKETESADGKRRWELLRAALAELGPPVGPLVLDTSVSRERGVGLVCHVGGELIRLENMGTGVQQLVALVGHLLSTNAKIVAIEEPELNLSHDLQKVLRDLFERIVADEAGPDQLFITSHSPVFAKGREHYFVSMTDHETHVEKREAHRRYWDTWGFEPTEREEWRDDARELSTAVSPRGEVRLPERVRSDLGLTQGGYVLFPKGSDGQWRVLREGTPVEDDGAERSAMSPRGEVRLPEPLKADLHVSEGDYIWFAKGADDEWRVLPEEEWDRIMEGLGDD